MNVMHNKMEQFIMQLRHAITENDVTWQSIQISANQLAQIR